MKNLRGNPLERGVFNNLLKERGNVIFQKKKKNNAPYFFAILLTDARLAVLPNNPFSGIGNAARLGFIVIKRV